MGDLFRVVLGLLALLATLTACQSPGSAPTSTPTSARAPAATSAPTSEPTSAPASGGSARMVFAHYYPPLPISLDNADPSWDYYQRNYLTPYGENGKHAAYGGYLRDRPLPRPVHGPGWRLEDLQTEVRQAIAGELDGFTLNLIQYPGDRDAHQVTTARTMMQAAASVDPEFKIMLMLDMSGAAKHKPPAEVAAFVAELAASPSAYRLADGRLVLSTFKAESHDAAWWTGFLELMLSEHDVKVAFVPTFLDEQPYRATFAPISYGMGNWGARNPAANNPADLSPESPLGRAAAVRSLGKKWMQPVSIQDERPREGIFDEAQNTQNLRNTWEIARRSGAEWVQITTWNDYTEGTHLAPSVQHGYAFLDLNAYYAEWFKTGRQPKVVRDTIYLTHRTQPWAAAPTYPQSQLMKLRGGSPARDTVEALTFLTAPATVTIRMGTSSHSCAVPAGEGVCTMPLSLGPASAQVTRNGSTAAAVTSGHEVTSSPYVQDLGYVISSSSRPAPHLAVQPTE